MSALLVTLIATVCAGLFGRMCKVGGPKTLAWALVAIVLLCFYYVSIVFPETLHAQK